MPSRKAKTGLKSEDYQGFATEDARKAFEAVIDSFSKWRDEISTTTERNSEQVFEALSEAEKALGWPDEFVDGLRLQMEETTEAQVQFMDSVMDAWKEQLKNPSAPRPSFQKQSLQKMMVDPAAMMTAPFQFWMQTIELWQKAWMQALAGQIHKSP